MPYINVKLIILLIHVSIEDETLRIPRAIFRIHLCCCIICVIQRSHEHIARKGQNKINPIAMSEKQVKYGNEIAWSQTGD